jgi:hypothetical protein
MSEMFNEDLNDYDKNMKNIYAFNFGKQAFGFFGDNSKQITLEHSPQKNFNNDKKNFNLTENSNLYSLKTMDNTEANFKKYNFKSSLLNEFKFLSTESTKIHEKLANEENNINFTNSNNDVLCSGYFGQKFDTKKINDEKFSKITSTLINPFTDIVEEEKHKIMNDENKTAFKNMDKNFLEKNANNHAFIEDNKKNFNEFLNFRNFENTRNLNAKAINEENNFGVFKTDVNKDLYNRIDDNENKKQFNNMVRSVTISSFNSIINNKAINKSNLVSYSSSNIFDSFGLSQNSQYMPKKKSN